MFNLTKDVSTFTKKLEFDSFPGEAVEKAKLAIMDCLGCIIAGNDTPVGKIIFDFARDRDAKATSSIFGSNVRTSSELASLVNGTMAHALDYDDISPPLIGHPSVTLVPAIFALGEALNIEGQKLITSYLTGFEVEAKLGNLFNPSHYEHGWHSTSTLGTIGATAACAKLLDLSEVQIEMALGIACSFASGLRQNFGTMTKPLHAGRAAQNGIVAALLAKQNFTSHEGILDSPKGFINMFSVKGIIKEETGFSVDSEFEIIKSGVTIKKHACCGSTHTAIDGVISIVNQYNIKPQDIEEIKCEVNPLATNILIYNNPTTGLEGKFCMEYSLAIAAIDRKAGLEQFSDKRLSDPLVKETLSKVKVYSNSDIANVEVGTFASIITLTLTNGRTISEKNIYPVGHHKNPMSKTELQEKFRECVNGKISIKNAQLALEYLDTLDKIKDVSQLINLLTN